MKPFSLAEAEMEFKRRLTLRRPKQHRSQAPDVPDLAQTVKPGSDHSENLTNVFNGGENGNFS